MADSKITALAALTAADPVNDMFPVVDVSDTSMAASGTTKRISANNILSSSPTASGALTVTGLVTAGSATITGAATVGTTLGVTGVSTLASAVVTGDLTVDTSTLKVDSTNNRVGIGTATPNYILDILGAAPRLHIKDNATNSSLVDIENGAGTLYVGRENSTGSGGLSGVPYAGIMYLQGAYPLIFGTNFIERARLNSTGAFVLAGGTTTANGIGVAFPTTQSASSDANTLDDYEEGTFTATLKGGTTDPTIPVTATGKYTKIGRQVFVQIEFADVSTVGASGTISVTGLPFTSASGSALIGYLMVENMATFTNSSLSSYLPASSSTLSFYTSTSNSVITAITHNAGVARYLWAAITYTV